MNGGIVTECPECETRFNVSDGQLKLADGKVRCGACLRVFDARAHQPYSETPHPKPESGGKENNAEARPVPQEYSLHVRYAQNPRVSTAAETQRPAEPVNPLDDPTAFDPDAPLEVSSPAEAPQDRPQRNWRRTAPEKPSTPIPIARFLQTPAQDAAPEKLPEQPPEQPPITQPGAYDHAGTGKYGQKAGAVSAAEPIAADEPVYDHDRPTKKVAFSERKPEPAMEVPAAAPMPAQNSQEQPAASSTRPEPGIALATEAGVDSQVVHEPIRQAAPQPQRIQQPPQQSTPQPQGLAALQDLHAEPLELMHPVAPAAPGAVLGWSLGCLLASVLLVSQLAWFNRIEWSREPLLADAYDILCHQLECDIPPYQAVELIHNRQLVVRAHPRYEDALSIDLLLENTASFRQPFPAIALSFSDIRGRTVARRVLQPKDYLDDILDPLKMPNSQPYQVNLAILDPGRRAVSYEVQLAPAQL
jgi:predicted Zn finger-like uncharacterized protein